MNSVVAIANQKGGVAKTTTAVNLAAALAMAERRTLVVDMDPQGNSTSGLGLEKYELERGVYHALLGLAPMAEVIKPTRLDFLKVAPANRHLVGAELELVDVSRREFRLLDALSPVLAGYEFVLIDCPPSLGLLTVNAMVAAGQLLIPLQAEYYSLEGVSELVDTMRRVKAAFNPRLEIRGVLLTMVDERTNLAQQVADEVRQHFKGLVYETFIPRNVRLAEAPSFGAPVMLYDVASKGARAYLDFAQEFLRDGKTQGAG